MADFFSEDHTQEIREAVESYFAREEAKYQPFDENDIARASYSVKTKFGSVRAYFHAHRDSLVIKMYLPIKADEDERAHVGEFLSRANYGLKIGCFDYDYNDGEISFRVTHFCGSEEFQAPTYEQIDFLVILCLMMVSKYGNALVKVAFGVLDPEEAIELAEDKE